MSYESMLIEKRDIIKSILCQHYNLPRDRSEVRVSRRNILGFAGENKQYSLYVSALGHKYKIFAKVSDKAGHEYDNLRFLEMNSSLEYVYFPRPVGFINIGKEQLLLLEHIDGFQNLSKILCRMFFRRSDRIEKIVNINKLVLRTIHDVHRNIGQIQIGSLGYEGARALDVVRTIRAIPAPMREKVTKQLYLAIKNAPKVRRGVTHGDLGARNILLSPDRVILVDWEKMQKRGFLCVDSCMFISYLVMRCLQLCIRERRVQDISDRLYRDLSNTKFAFSATGKLQDNEKVIRLAKCFAEIEVLSGYEKRTIRSVFKNIVLLRNRQIKYLVNSIIRDVDSAE
jgi:hypothetical protein